MVITFSEYATQIQRNTLGIPVQKRLQHDPQPHAGKRRLAPGRLQQLPPASLCAPVFHWLYRRHISYYMSILGGASALEFPYKNHELLKTYPWLSLSRTPCR